MPPRPTVLQERFGSVPVHDMPHLLGNLVQRLLNGNAFKCPIGLALQGMEQAIRTVLRFVTLQAFETGITVAHRIVVITADTDDPLLIIDGQLGTASRCTSSAKGRHYSHGQSPRAISKRSDEIAG